jgi:hypothetical protein
MLTGSSRLHAKSVRLFVHRPRSQDSENNLDQYSEKCPLSGFMGRTKHRIYWLCPRLQVGDRLSRTGWEGQPVQWQRLALHMGSNSAESPPSLPTLETETDPVFERVAFFINLEYGECLKRQSLYKTLLLWSATAVCTWNTSVVTIHGLSWTISLSLQERGEERQVLATVWWP